MKASKGFTLIELMIVIAIIGILASVVSTALSGGKYCQEQYEESC